MATAPGTPSPTDTAAPAAASGQTLSTSCPDPKNPGSPWVITTTRLPKETLVAWFKRHQAAVTAVNRFLKDV